MVLLRVRTDKGAVGLGEAVPLSLRGGETLSRVERSLLRLARRLARLEIGAMTEEEPLGAAVDAVINVVAGRRLPAPAKAAVESGHLRPRRPDVGDRRFGGCCAASPRRRCDATRRSAAGSPSELAAEAARWRERGFETFKLKLGIGDDAERARAVRDAVGPDARLRVDANGAWSADRAIAVLDEIEPLVIELAEQPTATLREMAAVAAATPIPIAADESVTSAKDAKRAVEAGACRLATVKLSKVGGIGPAGAIGAELPVYLSSSLDGPVGIAAAAHAAAGALSRARGSGARARPRHAGAVRRHDRLGAVRGARRASAPARWARARASRSTSGHSSGTVCSPRVPFAAVDATNRNTALASALVEELARCGARRAALAPGSRSTPLALALWRQPAIEVAVIVDERSAGYFALGAAQADGRPAIVLCTSGTAAANLHPAVCEADEAGVPVIVLTADRPPELRGIGAGQTIDQLKLYGSAVRWFCEVGNHEADDAGLLHFRSVACRAYAAARGEPPPGPGPPERRLARPAGPGATPRGRNRHLATRPRGSRRAAADGRRLRGATGRRVARRRARRAGVGLAPRPRSRRPPAGREARRAASPPWPSGRATRSSPSRPRSCASAATIASSSSGHTTRSPACGPRRSSPSW